MKTALLRDSLLGLLVGSQIGLVLSAGHKFVVWAILFAVVCEVVYNFNHAARLNCSRQKRPTQGKLSLVLLLTVAAGFFACYFGMAAGYSTVLLAAQWLLVALVLTVVVVHWANFKSNMPRFFPVGATSVALGTIGALTGTHLANDEFHLTGSNEENLQLCILVGTFVGTYLGRCIGELLRDVPHRNRRTSTASS
jgi:hypothetical protein